MISIFTFVLAPVKRINQLVDPPVFWFSNLSLFSLVGLTLWQGHRLAELTKVLTKSYVEYVGWLFVFCILWVFVFVFRLFFKHGNLKLGGADAKPEFPFWAWIAMLFSAGLGTGLVYSGVFEPVSHFISAPQFQDFEFKEKVLNVFHTTYFHWGVVPWSLYAATAIMFALSQDKGKRGFQFSAILKSKSRPLHTGVNVAAVLSILAGVVSTFSYGVTQINAGLSRLIPSVEISYRVQALLIVFVTLIATYSVLSGLKKGIKVLSQLNVILALLLFVYVLFQLPLVEFAGVLMESFGLHLAEFSKALTYVGALESDKIWLEKWTFLYWAWWTAWAPFVGLFIARISRGRTIKEFVVGVVFLPSAISFVWFTTFGYLGIKQQHEGVADYTNLITEAPYKILFTLLEATPLPLLFSVLALVCVLIFYVTSSDSGSYVVDMITSGGKPAPHPYLKIYWSCMEGLLAIVLLAFGGTLFIKHLVILSSLPVLLYICYGIFRCQTILKNQITT